MQVQCCSYVPPQQGAPAPLHMLCRGCPQSAQRAGPCSHAWLGLQQLTCIKVLALSRPPSLCYPTCTCGYPQQEGQAAVPAQ